jgi:hypothetical protein
LKFFKSESFFTISGKKNFAVSIVANYSFEGLFLPFIYAGRIIEQEIPIDSKPAIKASKAMEFNFFISI